MANRVAVKSGVVMQTGKSLINCVSKDNGTEEFT
jgi:hypothetical protein